MRTGAEVDGASLDEARRVAGLRTNEETVQEALRLLARLHGQSEVSALPARCVGEAISTRPGAGSPSLANWPRVSGAGSAGPDGMQASASPRPSIAAPTGVRNRRRGRGARRCDPAHPVRGESSGQVAPAGLRGRRPGDHPSTAPQQKCAPRVSTGTT